MLYTVDCVGAWAPWGTCSATCGGGVQTQTFSITTQASGGGLACLFANGDIDSVTQACGWDLCPCKCVLMRSWSAEHVSGDLKYFLL
jgi:hypothetical protein